MTKHQQVRAHIIALAKPDEQIPSERELATVLNVSRDTVRHAVDDLVHEGVLRKVAGVGTFVTAARVDTQLRLSSFSQEMLKRGMTPSTRLLRFAQELAPAEIRSFFGVSDSTLLWHIVRVRLADASPMAHEDAWYSVDMMPDLDRFDVNDSLYSIMETHYGSHLTSAEQTVWAEMPSLEFQQELNVAESIPLLAFLRRSFSTSRAAEFVTSRYRADRYQIHMDLKDDESV